MYGVIFLFKYNADEYSAELSAGEYDEDGSNVFFAHQRIQNACATQAVLNVLMNREDVDLGPILSGFKEFVGSFDPEMKGETISNSDEIRLVHNSFSSPNMFVDDTQKPRRPTDDDDLYHFIGFVRAQGLLYELDGLKPYPVVHDTCEDDDEFMQKVPEILGDRIARSGGELRFSVLAMVQDRREVMKILGDEDGVALEQKKRDQWRAENEMRRKDHIGLVHQIVKTYAETASDEQWNASIKKANDKGYKKLIGSRLKNMDLSALQQAFKN